MKKPNATTTTDAGARQAGAEPTNATTGASPGSFVDPDSPITLAVQDIMALYNAGKAIFFHGKRLYGTVLSLIAVLKEHNPTTQRSETTSSNDVDAANAGFGA